MLQFAVGEADSFVAARDAVSSTLSTLMKRPLPPLSSKSTMPSIIAKRESSLARPTFLPALYCVPRWRIRMLPPVTACPPKRLMPSRWPCESRPFVDDPPPFLCAMRSSKKHARCVAVYEICAGQIALRKLNVHFHGRQTLPVAGLNLVLPARLVLERFELGAAQMLHNLAGHFGFRRGGAQNFFVVGADGDDVVKRHLAADLALETL